MSLRRRLFTLLCGVAAISAVAVSPRELFVNAPRDVIAAIDSITRLDMIDYYTSGSAVASHNDFGGDVRVKMITDESITVDTSSASEVIIATIPSGRDTMCLVINTLALPAPDSSARIYSNGWQAVSDKMMLPEHNDLSLWLTPESKNHIKDIENAIPFIPAIYNYNNGVVTMTHTLSRLLPEEDYKQVKQYLLPSLSYKWNGRKWSRVK